MSEPAPARAGEIKPDPAEMHLVRCPNCARLIGEAKVLPGSLSRYRCQRCGEWTWLVGVATVAAAVVDAKAATA